MCLDGNTSASLAIYGGVTGLFKVIVLVGSGKIAYGNCRRLSITGGHLQIQGTSMMPSRKVRLVSKEAGIYLCNSVNPFPSRGAEIDHVPRPRRTRLAGAGLDRCAGRESGETPVRSAKRSLSSNSSA